MTVEPQPLAAPPHLLRDAGGPVFAEPWQAQAFALAAKPSEQGHFTWKEWASALAEELRERRLTGVSPMMVRITTSTGCRRSNG